MSITFKEKFQMFQERGVLTFFRGEVNHFWQKRWSVDEVDTFQGIFGTLLYLKSCGFYSHHQKILSGQEYTS